MNINTFIDNTRRAFPFLTPEMEERFAVLDGLYRDWNGKINVISRKDIDALYDHHVLHSLAIARYLMLRSSATNKADFMAESDHPAVEVLDLGTGGGFPGIPLAILFPEAHFTLCDSVGKKTIVAEAVARALELSNVTVVNARAESLGRDFDFVVSRAVATLEDLYPWVKGRFRESLLLLKGGDTLAEELSKGMARHRLPKGSVATWPISAWLSADPWYEGKFVVEVRRKA